jgi:hypothetical protein
MFILDLISLECPVWQFDFGIEQDLVEKRAHFLPSDPVTIFDLVLTLTFMEIHNFEDLSFFLPIRSDIRGTRHITVLDDLSTNIAENQRAPVAAFV